MKKTILITMVTGFLMFTLVIGFELSEPVTKEETKITREEYNYLYEYEQVTRELTILDNEVAIREKLLANGTLQPARIERTYITSTTIEYVPIRRSGVLIDSKSFDGIVNVDERRGLVSKWKVPIGDRNFKEFPSCLDYEIEKGVCKNVYKR